MVRNPFEEKLLGKEFIDCDYCFFETSDKGNYRIIKILEDGSAQETVVKLDPDTLKYYLQFDSEFKQKEKEERKRLWEIKSRLDR